MSGNPNANRWTNAGGDFSTTVSASRAVSSLGQQTWDSTTQLVADVQAWLNDSSTNFGWLLLGNESTAGAAQRFDSREISTSSTRPQLTVDFTPPFVPITISGQKFRDNNGDSVKNGADDGLPNWTIFLDNSRDGVLNNPASGDGVCDASATEPCTLTDGSGNFSLTGLGAGTYRVREVLQSSWIQTTANPADIVAQSGVNVGGVNFGNFQKITISGQKFEDHNGNGLQDTGTGDQGLAGWTIFLDTSGDGVLNNATSGNGVCDANAVELCAVTNSTGNFSITGVGPGTQRVREVVQAGWLRTTTNPADIETSSGVPVVDVHFGNFQRIAISGQKFEDHNGDGVQDAGDQGLPGWTLFVDTNNDGVLNNAASGNGVCNANANEPCSVTDSSGNYSISGLGPGTYRVREAPQADWQQTTPDPADIVASSGTNVGGVKFGNFQKITIGGQKFEDHDGDGVQDASDQGLGDWTLFLDTNRDGVLENATSGNGVCDASATEPCAVTDSSGNYSISGLGPGTYRVRELPQAGWLQTTADPADIVASSGTNVSGVNFGNLQVMTVSLAPLKDNTLYEDTNGALSNGSGQFLFAGKNGLGQIRRGVIAFDVAGSSIPPGSIIRRVTLTLHASMVATTAPKQVELHRLLADWGEGSSDAPDPEGSGTAATTGDATWIHTFFDTQFWANAGGDFSATISSSASVGDVGFYSWKSTDQMVADVQSWLDNPANKVGWLLQGDESASTTAKRFDSRENPTAADRPVLTIDFTVPFLPITISGRKFEDHDGNSVQDANDQPLSGWAIFLDTNNDGVLNNPTSGNGVCDASAAELCGVTDSGGNYSFTGLGQGMYRVREVPQPGWMQTTVNPADIVAQSGVNVPGVDFGNFRSITISGQAFDDADGDGVMDSGEQGLANQTIQLDKGGDNTIDATATTDANGNYQFANVGPGSYAISEASNAKQTLPLDGSYMLTASSGQNAAGRDFGNDLSGPQVAQLQLALTPTRTGVARIDLMFNEALDAAAAVNSNNYRVASAAGSDKRFGTGDDKLVKLVNPPAYDSNTHTIHLMPARPLKLGKFVFVTVLHTAGLMDLHGNLLGAAPLDTTGSDVTQFVARGMKLAYTDHDRDKVTLTLTGGGTMQLTRGADGEGLDLVLFDTSATRSILSGTDKPPSGRTAHTTLRSIAGTPVLQNKVQTNPAFKIGGGVSAVVVDSLLESGELSRWTG